MTRPGPVLGSCLLVARIGMPRTKGSGISDGRVFRILEVGKLVSTNTGIGWRTVI